MESNPVVYQGTPREIVIRVSTEIADILQAAGTQPTGIHLLAMLHLVACIVRMETESPNPASGRMPSFSSMLSLLTHHVSATAWTDEEARAFDTEFASIVESLGGHKMGTRKDLPMIMSPSLGVH